MIRISMTFIRTKSNLIHMDRMFITVNNFYLFDEYNAMLVQLADDQLQVIF